MKHKKLFSENFDDVLRNVTIEIGKKIKLLSLEEIEQGSDDINNIRNVRITQRTELLLMEFKPKIPTIISRYYERFGNGGMYLLEVTFEGDGNCFMYTSAEGGIISTSFIIDEYEIVGNKIIITSFGGKPLVLDETTEKKLKDLNDIIDRNLEGLRVKCDSVMNGWRNTYNRLIWERLQELKKEQMEVQDREKGIRQINNILSAYYTK